jgi:hypothetical protein
MSALSKLAAKSSDSIVWKPFFDAANDDEWFRVVFSDHPPQFTDSLLHILSASKNPTTKSDADKLALKIKNTAQ